MPEKKTAREQPVDKSVDDEAVTEEGESREYGGPRGMEPTRYGDWEKNGRCIDF